MLHVPIESSKVSLLEKTPQERRAQFGSRGSEGFQSSCFQHAVCNSQQEIVTVEF